MPFGDTFHSTPYFLTLTPRSLTFFSNSLTLARTYEPVYEFQIHTLHVQSWDKSFHVITILVKVTLAFKVDIRFITLAITFEPE